ncbi:MAG: hypothetical protein HC835_01900 [Oscillatoriales cyanobacterium RM2_1_1]|nr:hypothetical protein [Oscillatoriales cyanobacterium SM2_3_0]NJO44478.1 hypothetical protein [Oscillatoriales cyanobacterium RM2_1_1]
MVQRQPRPLILAALLTGTLIVQAYHPVSPSGFLPLRALMISGVRAQTPEVEAVPYNRAQSQIPQSDSTLQPNLVMTLAQAPQGSYLSTQRSNFPGFFLQDQPLFNRSLGLNQVFAEASNQLPDAVAAAVLKDVMERSGLPQADLKIIEAKSQMWPDGCLGLAKPNEICTMAIVPGWRVTIRGSDQRWVYRTNQRGTLVKLDESMSQSQGTIESETLNWKRLVTG